jgi:tRNA A37 threonylcarbamoyladenosine dehydratase
VTDSIDVMDSIDTSREVIKENIDYDVLCEQYGQERIDEVVELMVETVTTGRDRIRIAGDTLPAEAVKNRMMKLNDFHVEYVLDCMDKNTTKVRNIKAYILTALYNAPLTMDSYYQAELTYNTHKRE